MTRTVVVHPLPAWIDAARLLGDGPWHRSGATWTADLPDALAADIDARLRGLHLDGAPMVVAVSPKLPRPLVRAARTTEARRHRDTSPGFTRPDTRLDAEGRWSLTPEDLALAMGRRAAAHLGADATVLDAGCGAGGNAIGFARAGLRVDAVEQDPTRADAARHNARAYGVAERVRVRVGDAVDAIATTAAALVFVDPPWADHARGPSTAASLPPLRAVLDAAAARGLPVWAKVPPGFDTRTVPGARAAAWFGVAPGDRQRVKFVLLDVAPPTRADAAAG